MQSLTTSSLLGNSPERKTSGNDSPLPQQQNSVVPHQNSLEETEVSPTVGIMGQPSSLGASFTASKSSHQKPSKQLGSNSPSLSSHETHHSIHSQTNSAASSIPGTPPVYASSIPGTPPVYASSIPGTPPVYDHITIPYPPPVSSRCSTTEGVSQLALSGDSESTASEVITSGRTSTCSDTETTTCSEVEEVTEDYLQGWSKDVSSLTHTSLYLYISLSIYLSLSLSLSLLITCDFPFTISGFNLGANSYQV